MPEIQTIAFEIEPMPPFRLDYTVWCLRRRPENQMDGWDGKSFSKLLALNGIPHLVVAEQTGPMEDPRLRITVRSSQVAEQVEDTVTHFYTHLLGLEEDLSHFYRLSRKNGTVHQLAQRFLGLKPPRFPTIFESILNGIVCQQISLNVCIQLLSRMTKAYGMMDERISSLRAFPRPADLPLQPPDALRAMGLSRQKSAVIIGLAQEIQEGALDLESISAMNDADAERFLRQIRGVGPWTAQYVLLRGLGRLHIFPSRDVGAQNKLRKVFLWDMEDKNAVTRILEPIYPYAGMLYFHLLLNDLADKGLLDAPSSPGIWSVD